MRQEPFLHVSPSENHGQDHQGYRHGYHCEEEGPISVIYVTHGMSFGASGSFGM